eukprot:IDg15968t1
MRLFRHSFDLPPSIHTAQKLFPGNMRSSCAAVCSAHFLPPALIPGPKVRAHIHVLVNLCCATRARHGTARAHHSAQLPSVCARCAAGAELCEMLQLPCYVSVRGRYRTDLTQRFVLGRAKLRIAFPGKYSEEH